MRKEVHKRIVRELGWRLNKQSDLYSISINSLARTRVILALALVALDGHDKKLSTSLKKLWNEGQ